MRRAPARGKSAVRYTRWRTRRRLRAGLATVGGALAVAAGLLFGTPLLARKPATITEPTTPIVLPEAHEFPPDPLAPADAKVSAPVPQSSTAGEFDRISDIPTPPAREGLTSYEVQPGDVLWQIAERFRLRTETLVWGNDLQDPALLLVGQRLVIPPADGIMYTVKAGDSVADIAAQYGVELEAVVRVNAVPDPDQVRVGSNLFLPDARPLHETVANAAQNVRAPESSLTAALAAPAIPLPANIEALLGSAWLRAQRATTLFRTADQDGRLQDLPAGVALERLEGLERGRIQVRTPGDGRTRQAMTGWVTAADLDVGRAAAARELSQAYPADAAMDIAHIFAPYRSQLDGSTYAQANCGPTTIAMALEAFGIDVSSRQLRTETLAAQRIWGDGVGTLITALADVVGQHGLRALDLMDANGTVRRWSADDIRAHLASGRPVVVQVRYRGLPGRQNAAYSADHYILVTGILGDRFLYNDAIDADGVGWDRVIAADRLEAAMNASDRHYAFSAFAVGR